MLCSAFVFTWGKSREITVVTYWGNNHLLLEPFHLEIFPHAQAQGFCMEAALTWLRLYRTFCHRAGLCQVPSKQGDYCQGVPQLLGSTHKELQLQPLENHVFEEGFFS